MEATTVWVHVESDGQQWRVLGVHADPRRLTAATVDWEAQSDAAFVRIRDDGWQEWLEPCAFHGASLDAGDDRSPDVDPVMPAAVRSPWARPIDADGVERD